MSSAWFLFLFEESQTISSIDLDNGAWPSNYSLAEKVSLEKNNTVILYESRTKKSFPAKFIFMGTKKLVRQKEEKLNKLLNKKKVLLDHTNLNLSQESVGEDYRESENEAEGQQLTTRCGTTQYAAVSDEALSPTPELDENWDGGFSAIATCSKAVQRAHTTQAESLSIVDTPAVADSNISALLVENIRTNNLIQRALIDNARQNKKVVSALANVVDALRGLPSSSEQSDTNENNGTMHTPIMFNGIDLMKVAASSAAKLGLELSKIVWTKKEMMEHMLEPKNEGPKSRPPFSPESTRMVRETIVRRFGLYKYETSARPAINQRGLDLRTGSTTETDVSGPNTPVAMSATPSVQRSTPAPIPDTPVNGSTVKNTSKRKLLPTDDEDSS